MLITITEVRSERPEPVGRAAAHGYRVRFASELVAGDALLVAADDGPELAGRQCYVETGYERVEGCRVLRGLARPTPSMRETESRGDYALEAAVQAVTPLSDDEGDTVVDVAVGDIAFALSAREIGEVPRVGDILSCTVRGLSLWDEAI